MTVTADFTLTPLERKSLLADARETIAAKLEGRRPEYFRDPQLLSSLFGGMSALLMPCGAFVTLHAGKELRGCIGRMDASEPLQKTIRLMAIEAAFSDPRFPPLTKQELSRIKIEISVLSSMEECSDPRSVKVGVHGLYLNYQGRSGVLLPQVPVEQGWDLDEYLSYICTKAGLQEGSYQAPGAKLCTFTAIVFGED
ncbi:MAG: AmmeMemoRadiSam system protein A [Treponema sp.]|jgi:AmmeMemoRadiSam system protein A|nr:AmmeMemoRadiSam system protein A [Treponema sp.]